MKQIQPQAALELEKQAYRLVGSHSAVKVCGWTKKMIRGEGGCYKLKFYGIMSNQCMQMTTSMSCANRCTFCWRGYKAPVSKDWKWEYDEPLEIIDGACEQHHNLLVGFKGSKESNNAAYESSRTIKHVALSLTGEPITYPKINEVCEEFHKRGVSTFLVTNATYPEQIKNLVPITQLYLSLDAPNKELLKEVDKPLFPDYWERLNQSLEYLSEKKARTCVRVTCIKDVNMTDLEGWAALLRKGDPDFIEVKGYMFIGASRQRLSIKNMPYHEEVVEFSKRLEKLLPDHSIVSEHVPSRVVMLAKDSFKKDGVWHTWIDFKKFDELANSGKEFTAMDYLRKTPQVGLSGVITKKPDKAENVEEKRLGTAFTVNEDTQELDFWEGQDVTN